MRISLTNPDRSFSVTSDQPVLEGALNAGLNLPHSCKGGNCGSCRARLLQGEIRYPHGRPLGLSDAEMAEGMVLLCQARALSDLTLETYSVGLADEVQIKRLPCRIERTAILSHDVMAVFLKLPVAESFVFTAGQYIDVMLAGGRRRSFSIASPPHESRVLELHVRKVAGGEFTEQLFAQHSKSTLLTIEGPLGQFKYRPADEPARPMLLIGGGTGLAPLYSILRHVVEQGLQRDMTLYWGVRSELDLYAHENLLDLARRAVTLRYAPVLSEAAPTWSGLTGWVHEAAIRGTPHLADYDVYASGPPAMIEAVRREFGQLGVSTRRLFFDSFDYAPDTQERHKMIAATRS